MTLRSLLLHASAFVVAPLILVPTAAAQSATAEHFTVPYTHDSGWVTADEGDREVVASFTVSVPTSTWLRLYFDSVDLAGDPKTGKGAEIRITSHLDGEMQVLNAISAEQWQLSSCYFNGDTVQVDVVATPGTGASRIVLREVDATGPQEDTICGNTDDRAPSTDPRAARLLPVGCTGWLIDDCNHCFLTAGHCSTSASSVQVVQFNVPISNSNGSLNHPPADDQYAFDTASRQSNNGQGIGNDWAYFGAFANPNTGLTAGVAQGSWYTLASPGSGTSGDIRITGYGVDSSPSSWNQIQQTHSGPWISNGGTTIGYRTDTRGGNSGSPVIRENTGEAIAIHAHGGCGSTPGSGQNYGTSINHPAIQAALANPSGVCSSGCSTDDIFEDNDSCTQAAVLSPGTYAGLLAVAADQDYFEVDVPAGSQITVDSLFTHSSGDIDMRLWNSGCATQLAISQSTSDNEQVVWSNNGSSTETVVFQVYVYQGAGTNGYGLIVDVTGAPGGCATMDDSLEDNDDCGQELSITNGLYSALVVSKTDWDYYALSVAPGGTLAVDLSFTHASGDVDMFLYESVSCAPFSAGDVGCAGTLACGFSGNDNESLVYTNSTGAAQSLVLKVNVYLPSIIADCNSYDMLIAGAGDGSIGMAYCSANPNSTGATANISATGSLAASDNDVTLTAADLPLNAFGFFITSTTQGFVANPGGSSGNLCIVGDIGRYVGVGQIQNSGASGTFELALDLTAIPQPMGPVAVAAGETWNFQAWLRDSSPSGPTSNFTNGLEATFQ